MCPRSPRFGLRWYQRSITRAMLLVLLVCDPSVSALQGSFVFGARDSGDPRPPPALEHLWHGSCFYGGMMAAAVWESWAGRSEPGDTKENTVSISSSFFFFLNLDLTQHGGVYARRESSCIFRLNVLSIYKKRKKKYLSANIYSDNPPD